MRTKIDSAEKDPDTSLCVSGVRVCKSYIKLDDLDLFSGAVCPDAFRVSKERNGTSVGAVLFHLNPGSRYSGNDVDKGGFYEVLQVHLGVHGEVFDTTRWLAGAAPQVVWLWSQDSTFVEANIATVGSASRPWLQMRNSYDQRRIF